LGGKLQHKFHVGDLSADWMMMLKCILDK